VATVAVESPPRRPARIAEPRLRARPPPRDGAPHDIERRDDHVTSYSEDPNRTGKDSLAIALSTVSIAAGAVGIAILPALLTPAAVVLALAAVLTSNYARAFTGAAFAFAAVAWMTGMIIVLFTHHSLF
jgi:hypothetical protein